ncbi:thioredoxin-like protein [Coccomyxa subellipsoidea C-169]|uniref:Thioredoxin-like protein n=1 Tax=Coccomyxa subellipsoidea (strain C-169) TaxID=574566 RepID=I0YYL2_COCSC|nr:thioredoxin-like protein [Coccomyxa subellipsoidea C-169]EIE23481.1 thioredoxin-like protein [Coccomyxa subellipsoidea C-169]|eukprot:XP_005648025.1 thioredoxin-like protein [Coccomyxa subellipsoidea C-169]
MVPRPRSRQVARASREEAIANMQSYKAGLTKALTSREDSLRAEVAAKAATVEEGSSEQATTLGLRELNKDDYYPFLKENADKLVIVDFYTDWCGPCKLMVPILEELARELKGRAEIVKFNCNKNNKELGVSLGIKVAPTFHLYRAEKQVAMMTGAKIDELRELIDKHI